MSLMKSGKWISCDGERCDAVVEAPIALRSVLSPSPHREHAASRWLFVARKDSWRHFCPRCAPRHLHLLTGIFAAPNAKGDTP
jgi:hypothetical protein